MALVTSLTQPSPPISVSSELTNSSTTVVEDATSSSNSPSSPSARDDDDDNDDEDDEGYDDEDDDDDDDDEDIDWPKQPPRKLVWGAKVVRNVLPHRVLPAWLDPEGVDIDDPRKLPLCWYGVPFHSDLIFAYAQRIRLAVYMKHENLRLKPGDLDIYGTWPRLVDWFKGESGFTMHLHQVWDERKPLLTFFSNHELEGVTTKRWRIIRDLLADIGYPKECKAMWYLDRHLDY